MTDEKLLKMPFNPDNPADWPRQGELLHTSAGAAAPPADSWRPITETKPSGKVLIFRRGWPAAYVAEWVFKDCDGGPEEGEYPGFWGWQLDDEDAVLGVEAGFLGWNEDIEAGGMPSLWSTLPAGCEQ